MRKIGLALAALASTAAIGVTSASAVTVSPLDQAKLGTMSNLCRNFGGQPSTFNLGVECDYVPNLNISRQVIAASICGALGWQFQLLKPVTTTITGVPLPANAFSCGLPTSD